MKLTKHLPTLMLLVLSSLFSAAQQAVAPAQFQELLNGRVQVQLIDVRTPFEYGAEHLKGAENVDFRSADFGTNISKLDKQQPVFVYCLSGGRSGSAARKLTGMGYDVYDMKGGIMAWKAANMPLDKDTSTKKPAGMSKAEYDKLIVDKVPVLINFYAPWCGPCRKMAPMLEELKNTANGTYKLMKLNADENDALLEALEVKEIPTFFIYKQGKLSWSHVGLLEKETLLRELGP